MTPVVGIETIPIEILCDIFSLLRGNQPIYLGTLDSAQGFPWAAAGQVCRRWRETFISHSPLWTYLSLYYPCGSAAHMAETNRRTVIYIKRSRQLPLTIEIYGHPSSEIMTTLVSCSNRWKNLYLQDNESFMDFFLGCKGNLPILTSLTIRGHVASNLSSIFAITPCLTELDLSEPILERRIAFPWAQLTKFSLFLHQRDYDRSRNELSQILPQLQNLEMLQLLSWGFPDFPRSIDFPVAHLPRLLFFETSLDHFEVFSWFIAPYLEHLRIRDFRRDCSNGCATYPNWNGVFSLINRSSCRVRRLSLLQGIFVAAPVMLEALANVEELIIEYPMNTFPTILRYIAGFNDHIYLPKLRVLKMKYCPEHNIGELVLTISQFLESRSKGSRLAPASCVPLEQLVIQLEWCPHCKLTPDPGNIDIPCKALEVIRDVPSDADIYIH
ncbi:hypothetical protein F5887DRAFT_238224 [Amanita rubescens]|nr:hypothetical protein F5887DRAFT_1244768 [Amanita rubescens]KAF8345026.1 hypothetical protein F5887DRAFT_238224 [Amanita rubescens]